MTPSDLIVSILRFALNSVLASLTLDPGREVEDLKSEREAAAAMLSSLDPRDAIQASFAARAVTAHHASMECFRRAAQLDMTAAMMNRLVASGMALSRMSVQLIKALEQRKGSVRPGAASRPLPMDAGAEARDPRSAELRRGAQTAGGGQQPMPSEKRAAGGADGQKPAHHSGSATRSAQPALTPTGLESLTDEELEAMAAIEAILRPAV